MNNFDLEQAIALWRRQYRYRGRFLREDLDELERHLRDHIVHLQHEGHTPGQAFQEASRALGGAAEAETEYRKVFWGKLKRRGHFLSEFKWRLTMWINYLKIALRTLKRQPGSSFINVSGLAIGMACCLLIFLFVHHEWSYDRFHAKADVIYRVVSAIQQADGDRRLTALSPMPMADALTETYPEVRQAVRFTTMEAVVRHDTYVATEEVVFADASLFDMFSFALQQGHSATALQDPQGVILSAEAAERYFPGAQAMGQPLTLTLDDKPYDVVVTGIAAPLPATSSIRFEVLLPLEAFPYYQEQLTNWGSSNVYTYIEVADAPRALQSKLPLFVESHLGERILDGQRSGAFATGKDSWALHLQPLTEVHLNPDIRWGLQPTSNPVYSYILCSMAFVILVIACINFVMLALARSARRAREIGMRKVMGAQPAQVRRQFWGESLLLSLMALMLGLLSTALFLPFFNDLAGRDLSLAALGTPELVAVLGGLVLLVSLMAGGYPALFVARLHPIQALKGKAREHIVRPLTGGLVVFQFTLSIVLVIGTLTMYRQVAFLQSKDLGYEADQVVVLPTRMNGPEAASLVETFRSQLIQQPGMLRVSSVNNSFTRGGMRTGLTMGEVTADTWMYFVDHDFLSTMGLTLTQGQGFDRDYTHAETPLIVVNEAFVNTFGLEHPVGQRLDTDSEPTIIGVVQDFHFQSLHHAVMPAVLSLRPAASASNILVQVRSENLAATLAQLKTGWEAVFPAHPFAYYFLDEDVQRQYQAEQRWQAIMSTAALLALLIACLGLFGISALMAAERTQEIGVRKVLGASIPSVILLLSKDFLKLVAIACVIAIPLGYLVAQRWLEDFAYHIDLGVGIFLLASGLAVLIALLTVSYQAIKAALANPIQSLRYE
ncbi:MAG TPA: ABC transporter permease [Rhodothermales bacterium]|nr:ABC transporter permease [Rhodothermales bacterium]